jgi:hypothetical protein
MRDPETFYDATAEDEWNRLDEGLDGRQEFAFTTDELDAVLPDAGHLVDVGGGAGRYAVRLACAGHDVTREALVATLDALRDDPAVADLSVHLLAVCRA